MALEKETRCRGERAILIGRRSALACAPGVGRPTKSAARITAAWRVCCAVEGKELPSGAHGSAGEVRAARVAGRAGWAGCARRGARECGPARTEGEAGDWAVREGVARSGPGRWVGGVKGWAGVENGLRGEGERKEVGLMGFLGRAGFWLVFLF